MSPTFAIALALSATAAFSGSVAAAVVTSTPAGPGYHTISFSPYDSVTSAGFVASNAVFVDVGTAETGVAVNLGFNNGADHILGAVPTSFGVNGSWPLDGAFAGLGQVSGFMSFSFDSGMDFAGGFVNYDPSIDGGASLTALDAGGNVLESIDFDSHTFTPGFFGFQRDAADIFQLVFSNASIAVDNLSFGAAPAGTGIPEPGTTGLVLASFGALALTRRRAR